MGEQGGFRSALGGVLLGTVVAMIGAFFVYALLLGVGKARETRGWQETPCVVSRSEVVEARPTPNSPLAYRAAVEYGYRVGGERFLGTNVKRVDGSSSHAERAAAVVERYPAGAQVSCWVDPEDPARAVLEHGTMAPLYTLWFPALFVVAGVGIAVRALRGR